MFIASGSSISFSMTGLLAVLHDPDWDFGVSNPDVLNIWIWVCINIHNPLIGIRG